MKNKKIKTRIMVFGTFDGLHPGHLNFFKQARNLAENSYLVVSIARDSNVLKIKGARPHYNEKKRFNLIKNSGVVDKVVFSGVGNYLPHIIKEHPDIIALGYDQRAYVKDLKKDLKNKGLEIKVVRTKPYKEKVYKNHLIWKKSL